METIILKGKPVSLKIKDDLSLKISDLKKNNIIPSLAAIIVGDDAASKLYVSSKAKAFSKLGCHSEVFELPSDTSEHSLKEFIEDLNNNDKFHGILLQLPLPKHLNEKDILKNISPSKDVDGLHPENQGYIMQGDPRFIPCTPLGCLKILDYYNIETKGNFIDISLSLENYYRLTVPPGIWMAFKGESKYLNLLLNIADYYHDPNEIIRLDLNAIEYNW